MANHGYITIKSRITLEQLKEDSLNILHERFNNEFEIKIAPDKRLCVMYRNEFVCDYWLETGYLIEMRHGNPAWCSWIESVLKHKLAIKYNGIITDDGCDDKWKGDLTIYPHYIYYLLSGDKAPSWTRIRHCKRIVKETVKQFGDIFDGEYMKVK